MRRLKDSYDIDLIAVGGFETDPLWHFVRTNLCYYARRIPSSDIVQYYGAADLSCQFLPSFSEYTISTAIEESLACGVPAVTNSLINIGSEEIIPLVGCAPKTVDDFEQCVRTIIDNRPSKDAVRRAARNLVGWDGIITQTLLDYGRLLNLYYG
jgi:glycosyltransferase involved in cell wall biosynthesis